MPLEPFSLKREREAGYFDEDGNYVAYRDAEAEDAWLRSLPRGKGPAGMPRKHKLDKSKQARIPDLVTSWDGGMCVRA